MIRQSKSRLPAILSPDLLADLGFHEELLESDSILETVSDNWFAQFGQSLEARGVDCGSSIVPHFRHLNK